MAQPEAWEQEITDPLLQAGFQGRIALAMETEQNRTYQALGDTAAFIVMHPVEPLPEPKGYVYPPGSRSLPDTILDVPDLEEPTITIEGIKLGLYSPNRIRSPRPRLLQTGGA